MVGLGKQGFPKLNHGFGMQLPPNQNEINLMAMADELQMEQLVGQEVGDPGPEAAVLPDNIEPGNGNVAQLSICGLDLF